MLHLARLILLALGLSLTACSAPDPQTRVSSALANEVFKPAYAAWAISNQQLTGSAGAFCGGTEDLQQAREALLKAQNAWAALQPLQLGLIAEGTRSWQVQFWPDKKNLVARQVEALLNSKPQLSGEDLQQASVVVQGLSAYEYLLFDASVDLSQSAGKTRYCPLLQSIAQHQKLLADEIFADWQAADGITHQLESFPNPRYSNAREAIAALLRAQVIGLDVMKKKLGTPLGVNSKGTPQPYQADSWRSGGSLGNLAAGIASAQEVWEGQEDNGLRSLLGADQQPLAKRIDQAYADTRQQLQMLQQSLTQLFAQDSARAQLQTLYTSIDQLHRLHERDLAKALNVQLGFNANDGD